MKTEPWTACLSGVCGTCDVCELFLEDEIAQDLADMARALGAK